MSGFGLIGKGKSAVANVDQDLQIWGLYHLIGGTVSVNILGLDIGDFTVATDGSITVSLVVTVGQTTAWSAAQLIAADGDYGEGTVPISVKNGGAAVQVSVPMCIGQPYISQGQRLRALAADDTRTPTGPALGMTRRGHQFAVLLQNAVQVNFGTTLSPPGGDMKAAAFTDAGGTPITEGTTFSGVYWDTLNDDYTMDSMFCWEIERPYPCTVCAAAVFLETEERL